MARYYGSTTERGIGWEHVKDKKRLKAQFREGDPCWRCGEPMYSWQELHRDHIIDRALGGTDGPAALAHAHCNTSAGASMGNRLRPRPPTTLTPGDVTCPACGQAYHYQARQCVICGTHYHPTHDAQQACGRACGWELRRRRAGNPPLASKPKAARRW